MPSRRSATRSFLLILFAFCAGHHMQAGDLTPNNSLRALRFKQLGEALALLLPPEEKPQQEREASGALLFTPEKISAKTQELKAFDILKNEAEKLIDQQSGEAHSEDVLLPQDWEAIDLLTPETGLLARLASPHTMVGKAEMGLLLTTPTIDQEIITGRQEIISLLASDHALKSELSKILKTIGTIEPTIIRLLDPSSRIYDSYTALFHHKIPFPNSTHSFYKNKTAQDIFGRVMDTSLMSGCGLYLGVTILLASALVYHKLSPAALSATLHRRYSITISPVMLTIGSLVTFFCAYKIANRLKDWIDLRRAVVKFIKHELIALKTLFQATRQLEALLEKYPALRRIIPAISPLAQEDQKALDALEALVSHKTFESPHYFLSKIGPVISALPRLKEIRSALFSQAPLIGTLDAYLSIAKRLPAHTVISRATKERDLIDEVDQVSTIESLRDAEVVFSLSELLDNPHPVIDIHDLWHPQINERDVIPNTITLGSINPQNGVLTGPNASGKSTTLRSVAIAALLSQSFGVAPARHCSLTPFSAISCYSNITDDPANNRSLFKAELYRALSLIERIAQLPPGSHSFAILDELFTGTQPKEGEAAAYSVSRFLGSFSRSITLSATNFTGLTVLEEELPALFANYSLDASVSDSSSASIPAISYSYQLKAGANFSQTVSQVLAQHQLSPEIITSMYEVLTIPNNYLPALTVKELERALLDLEERANA